MRLTQEPPPAPRGGAAPAVVPAGQVTTGVLPNVGSGFTVGMLGLGLFLVGGGTVLLISGIRSASTAAAGRW